MKKQIAFLLFFLNMTLGVAQNNFNIKDHGAEGDRTTNDAPAIQSAIDACAQAGGGTVYIPPGDYLTGPLFLKSHVRIHIEAGAALWAHPDSKVYSSGGDAPTSDADSPTRRQTDYALFNGEDLENIAITGRGTINGQGAAHWWGKERLRPYILRIRHSRNVRFEGVTTTGAPTHAFAFIDCDQVTIRDIALNNDPKSPNTGGIHLIGSVNVDASGMQMDTGGDCLMIEGRSANITVSNCTLNTPRGVLRIADGRNIALNNCEVECQTLLKDLRKAAHVTISDVNASGRGRLFSATGGTVKHITLSNVTASGFAQGGWLESAEDVTLDNVKVIRRFGSGSSAWRDGFEFRNIKRLILRNVEIQNIDEGPALVCENVENLELDGFRAITFPENEPAVLLSQVRDAYLHECRGLPETQFLRIEGQRTNNIRMGRNDLNGAAVEIGTSVPGTALSATPLTTSELTLPALANANEAIPVSVTVRNTGPAAGFGKVCLQVNGETTQTRWVWLNAGESRRLELMTGPFYQAQTYRITANEGTPKVLKLTPQPAALEYLELVPEEHIVKANTDLQLMARLKNVGSYPLAREVFLQIGSRKMDSRTVEIAPGETVEITFTHQPVKESLLLFSVDGRAKCAVKAYEDPLSATIAELGFERINKNVAVDRSGLGRHLHLKANPGGAPPSVVDGKIGQGLRFNGESAYGLIPNLRLSAPFSVSMWIKPGDLPLSGMDGRQMIFYAGHPRGGDGFGPEDETHIAREAGDQLVFWNRTGAPFELRTKIDDPNRFYFLTVVYGEGSANLYIDGELIERKAGLKNKPDFSHYADRIYIGRPTVDHTGYFNGVLDELRIYRAALSAEDVRRLYESYRR